MRRTSADYHPVDVHVGSRMRQRRSLLGMSQSALGNAVGLTFQQIQKYERGANRMGASRLFEFAAVLDVPVAYFFDELPVGSVHTRIPKSGADAVRGMHARPELDVLSQRETLNLVREYYEVRPDALRQKLFDLIRGLARDSRWSHKPPRMAAGSAIREIRPKRS